MIAEFHNRIEQYLAKAMSPVDVQQFEKEIDEDAAKYEEYVKYKSMLASFTRLRKVNALRSQLNAIHAKLDMRKIHEAARIEPMVSFIRNNQFWKQAGVISGIAASLALIITFAALFSTGVLSFNSSQDQYKQLVQKIATNQNNLVKLFKRSNMNTNAPMNVAFGTGFVVSSNGYLATSYHVIKNAKKIIIISKADTTSRFEAVVVTTDAPHDLALLKIADDNFKGFGRLPYNFVKKVPNLGNKVFTLGYSKDDIVFGEGSISSSSGFKNDTSSYQVSIPVNPGNSGGPVINTNGDFLGIISGKNSLKEGEGYAIKMEYLLKALEDFKEIDPSLEIKGTNTLSGLNRADQIAKLQPYIFQILFENNE